MSPGRPGPGSGLSVPRLVLGTGAALVVLAGGLTNPFTYWNLVPLLVAWVAISSPRRLATGEDGRRSAAPSSRRRPAAVFAVVVGAVEGLASLAWLFDWGGTASGSSTAGVLFVLLPVVALGIGGLVGLASGLAR